MYESGESELIWFNNQDGSFISASDALQERLDGLVKGEEPVFDGCSSTISFRLEVSLLYNSPED